MNEFQRGEQIRHIAKNFFHHIKDEEEDYAIQDLVDFATLINSKDMSLYAKTEDTKDIKTEIKIVEANLNAKIDKVEANLNAKIDKVEASLKSIISETQISIIKWVVVGMILAQTTGIVFLFLKLSGKY